MSVRTPLYALSAVLLAQICACADDPVPPREPLVGGPDVTTTGEMSLVESDIVATQNGSSVIVRLPVARRGNAVLPVTVDLALRHLDRTLIAQASRMVDLSEAQNEIVLTLEGLDETLTPGDLANVVIHYQVWSNNSMLFGRHSLYDAVQKRAIHLLSSDTFYDGAATYLRLMASDPVSGRPLADATVDVYFVSDTDETLVFSGATDEFGTLSAPVEASVEDLGNRTLRVVVTSDLGIETIERTVQVRHDQRILITTDKPLYQPGQTIHIRTLTLRRGDLHPAARQDMIIEVLDGRGNKIMRTTVVSDDFGVASTELVLARELNMGEFIIRATIGDTQSERTVTVDRYTLPRFALSLTPDAAYYLPGQEADVTIQATYTFGQPVADGTVVARVFAVEGTIETMLSELTGTLNEDGLYTATVTVPNSFSLQGLQTGTTFVRLDVTVADPAGQERDTSTTLPVAQTGMVMVAIPAHDLLPGQANRLFVLTSNPLGQPIESTCTATLEESDPSPVEVATDARGLGDVTLDAPAEGTLAFYLACAAGNASGSQRFAFDLTQSAASGAIAVLTDRSLVNAGDSLDVSILATGNLGQVFLDVIANRRTLSTDQVILQSGQASTSIDLPADAIGTVELVAYSVTAEGVLVRGQRLLYVEPANDLILEMTPDREEYRPGESAHLTVRVTNQDGQGVPAAVGLSIVDEAVFALQDMRPGAERLFFQLEQELLTPSYQTCGLDMGEVVDPTSASDDERDRTAEILFAATGGSPGYAIAVNTLAEQQTRAMGIVQARLTTDVQAIVQQEAEWITATYNYDWNAFHEDIEAIIAEMGVRHYDPWGQAYRFTPISSNGSSDIYSMRIQGAGPDEVLDTADDVGQDVWLDQLLYGQTVAEGGGGDFDGEPMPGMGDDRDEEVPTEPTDNTDDGSTGDSGPRVRSFFPETLLVEPALITNGNGEAELDVTLADSITTWRATGLANSQAGQLGSSSSGIRVFQPFFVDIDFPVSLTQNDEVQVPVALFNFLDEAQTVTLTVDTADAGWYELMSDSTITIELAPGQVTSVPIGVRVIDVGTHLFQVTAEGTTMSDAVARSVQVLPDGQEQLTSVSDRLDGDVTLSVAIPSNAIDGGSGLFVKVYPGFLSQAVEGLDSLLSQPTGCFEQTSSSTYPNVLVLEYLRETGQVTPEIEATALAYISAGYQALLSYEVPGGGFEWFGGTPAHRILTAYGLLEFSDMAAVFEVDPAVITRTQEWLLTQQETDGSFHAAPEGIHEGATNNFTDSDLRATAYITYALLESGYEGAPVDQAVGWVDANVAGATDPYTLALVANMFVSAGRETDAADLIDALEDQVVREDGTAHWASDSQSFTYGGGDTMSLETTALALYAYIRAGAHPQTVEEGISYLVQSKDAFGNWSNTQATILSLRTFIALLEGTGDPGAGTIDVFHNGDLVQTWDIDPETSEVMRVLDLSDIVIEGDNEIDLTFEGEGGFLFQVVGRYYIPWEDVPVVEPPLDLTVVYPSGPLTSGQPTTVSATVTSNLEARADMLMVHLGVPPGFDADLGALQTYIDSGLLSRVDRAGDGIDAYLYGIEPGAVAAFDLTVVPRFPMTVQSPASSAYLYYEPNVRDEAAPVEVVVE